MGVVPFDSVNTSEVTLSGALDAVVVNVGISRLVELGVSVSFSVNKGVSIGVNACEVLVSCGSESGTVVLSAMLSV